MKKDKLTLKELQVSSFATSVNNEMAMGGAQASP
ncbi:pinensin family lanthipeptide [Roseivirga sp. BDSF3-8]